MKAILFFCLLALFTCKVDILGVAKCFVSNQKTQKLGLDLFTIVLSKDYSKILPTILNAAPELYNVLMECANLKEIKKEDDEVILKDILGCKHIIKYNLCVASCNTAACREQCHKNLC